MKKSHKQHVRPATTLQFRRNDLAMHEIENSSDKGYEYFPTEQNIGMQGKEGVQELFFCELKAPRGKVNSTNLFGYNVQHRKKKKTEFVSLT